MSGNFVHLNLHEDACIHTSCFINVEMNRKKFILSFVKKNVSRI